MCKGQCNKCISRRTKGGRMICSLGIREVEGKCGSFEYGKEFDDYKFVYGGNVDSVTERWLNGEDV